MMAKGGAILVPIAVPLSCLKTDLSCSNISFFRTHSANLIKESVETVLSFLVSRAFLIAINPSNEVHLDKDPLPMRYIWIKTHYIYCT